MPVDTASSDSDQMVFRLDEETDGFLLPARPAAADDPPTGTDEHAPQTDPALSAETDTHRSDRIDALASDDTDTGVDAPGAGTWRRPVAGEHAPQTDPAAEAEVGRVSSGSRRRAPSEPGPALNPIGEGSVFRPPKRKKTAHESDTDEMHAVRRKTSSALRPVAAEVEEPGMNPLLLVVTAIAIVGGAVLLVWLMP